MSTNELPLEFLGITTPKGTTVHLYDVEADRLTTLCGRRIGWNPRHLGIGGVGPQVSSDTTTCKSCLRTAHSEEVSA